MAENRLLAAYLAVGDDVLKRERVEDRLAKRVGQLGDLSFNSERFDGESARGIDIVSACNTLPFMSDVRLVSVRNVEKLRKADADQVVSYLAAPSPTTVLALYANSLAKGTRLYKAVAAFGAKAVIDCSSVAKRELPALVVQMARSHGMALRNDSAARLVELVGEDTVRIDAELRKLSLAAAGSQSLHPEDITRLVGRTTEKKPWEFVDAFSERDPGKCLAFRRQMESTSPYALMSMCVTRVRELSIAKGMIARGQGKRLAEAIKGPRWKVERYYPGYARNFTAEELRRALRSARDAERAMKSGADPDAAFDSWYLSVLARG